MARNELPQKWFPGIGLISVMILLFGCSRPSVAPQSEPKVNNLHYVLQNIDCNMHSKNYHSEQGTEIIVNSTTGISLEDEVVVVCAGENLHWKGASDVSSFEVKFQNPWPFKPPFKASLPSNSQNSTANQQVDSDAINGQMYKYTIYVKTTAGKEFHRDPHVIPM
ncbi:MAG TPA: hypothetical protein VOA64_02910 [Candidatus Dormibacteraeota bacterium]|nr:hypothetical protein [Candidatus Dormibacteraeota bacterium]